jgi:lysophospholipid acyltransferase (LPLAT)-like uncharacterized protein
LSAPRKRLRDRVLPALVASLGPAILHLLAATWRVERVGAHPHVDRRSGKPGRYIIAFWHATLLPLTWLHRGEDATVLVSRHGDGELIARVLTRLGYRVARGSSTRGGARAALELLRFAEQATADIGITPDGPKGPAERAQEGIAFLAAKSGLPILPLAMVAERAWRLRSWDRFVIPKPFSRIAVATGQPIAVPPEVDRSAILEVLARYEAEMGRAAAVAAQQLAARS